MKNSILAPVIAAAALLLSTPVHAQEAGHEGHPPAAAAEQPKSAMDEPDDTSIAKSKMQGTMMGGGKCKMMEEMHGKMGPRMQPKGDRGPSSQAYNGITMRMHDEMAITYSGNADVDFVKGMIPHHHAAIDLAKTVIAFGADAEVKKVAEGIVKAQEAEIAQLKSWLSKQSDR